MTRYRVIALTLLLAAAVFIPHLLIASNAEAARMGSGKSFGGSPSYSRSAPAPAPAPRSVQPAPGSQYSQQQPGTPPMGAPRSGLGGMMGGLLAGSLLGALFFGGPHAGFGFIDMILFAALAFMGLKLFQAMRQRSQAPASSGAQNAAPRGPASPGQPDLWARMRSDAPSEQADSGAPSNASSIPANFDQADFLRGAKIAYTRLQESWDKRDLDDIARFTTQAIMDEVREQAKADPNPSRTDILLINANLISVEREGANEVASVFFDVLLREDPKAETPTQAREIWHFTRPAEASGSWKLDGIQQVDG